MEENLVINIHNFLAASLSNGPGRRAVIWTQGCSLGCPGCFNPATHPFSGSERIEVEVLFERLQALGESIEGLTISGGEPLQQRRGLLRLLARVRQETHFSVILFSGVTWKEIQRMPGSAELLTSVDVLLAGRYEAARRLGHGLLGSANKTVHFLTNRYRPADLARVPEAEIFISPGGEVISSGIDPVNLNKNL